jgi:hypothetical protein
MPSPFPGMNPYLEQADAWEDFHQSFITHARDALSGQVGPNYWVKIEERLYIHELSAEERRFFGRGDAVVTTTAPPQSTAQTATAQVAPLRLVLPAVDIQREAYLEIRDRRNRRVITVLELLSPTNKTPGSDRAAYLAKRSAILATPTHLVEIDLLRGGVRPEPPELPPCDYYILVRRAEEWPHVDVWPVGLRQSLPSVAVPLAAPDPPAQLDLQALLHRVYDGADYGKYIYAGVPEPPLNADDAVWARQLVPGLASA